MDLELTPLVVRAEAAVHVQAERPNRGDGLADILRSQTAGEEDRDFDFVADLAAEFPVLDAPGAPSSRRWEKVLRKFLKIGVLRSAGKFSSPLLKFSEAEPLHRLARAG